MNIFTKTLFVLRKSSFLSWLCRGFFWNVFTPTSGVMFSTDLAVRKNIFAFLFSVHDTISLSCHEQVCLISLRFERYFSHRLLKNLQICYKKRLKNFSESYQRNRTPSGKRLSQTPFFRFWLRASPVIESFRLKLKTMTPRLLPK